LATKKRGATQCADCNKSLTPEEIADPFSPDSGGPVCYTCEIEEYSDTCTICQELKRDDEFDLAFAVFDAEAAFQGDNGKVGIYRIKRRPFYMQGIVGSGWLLDDHVEWMAPLPDGAESDHYPCGVVCEECAAPHLKAAAQSDPCEWNLEDGLPLAEGQESHAPASYIVGVKHNWRLCLRCADLPEFKKFRKRRRIYGERKEVA
jgi:hypothetical protein